MHSVIGVLPLPRGFVSSFYLFELGSKCFTRWGYMYYDKIREWFATSAPNSVLLFFRFDKKVFPFVIRNILLLLLMCLIGWIKYIVGEAWNKVFATELR